MKREEAINEWIIPAIKNTWNEKKCKEIIKALEQEPCEDEYIKVPKKALKYRTAGMIAYNAEWLKNHFDIERAVICGEQEPCEMTAEEYRQRMIQAFHNADCDELIALVVLPTEKEFEYLGWLLEKHYKAKPEHCTDAISRQALINSLTNATDIAVMCGTVDKEASERYLPEIIRWFKSLPPVTPAGKVGR